MKLWVVYSNDTEYGGTSYVGVHGIFNHKIQAIKCILDAITSEYEDLIEYEPDFLSSMIKNNERFSGLKSNATWSDVKKVLKKELLDKTRTGIGLTEYAYEEAEYFKKLT